MALLTVEGVYRNGKLELAEEPVGVEEARVLVVFLPAKEAEAARRAPAVTAREALRQAAFADMERGIDLGGPPYPRREDLYDRFRR
jgi:hypothetical protein